MSRVSNSNSSWSTSTPKPIYSSSANNTTTLTSADNSNSNSAQVQETRDINEVTKRMLRLAVEANEMGSESLKELELQNEKIKNNQDDVATMSDELNVADRKLRGIKSFFSHIGNQFKKDNSTEHQKGRQKYEKELAKNNFATEAERMKFEEKKHEEDYKELERTQKEIMEAEKLKLDQAKSQSRQDYKAMKKGETNGDTVFMGKFSFQANAIPGEQCEAENDLDQVADHVKALKSKAEAMKGYVDESNKRIGDLNTDLTGVKERTVVATKKGEKIIKSG